MCCLFTLGPTCSVWVPFWVLHFRAVNAKLPVGLKVLQRSRDALTTSTMVSNSAEDSMERPSYTRNLLSGNFAGRHVNTASSYRRYFLSTSRALCCSFGSAGCSGIFTGSQDVCKPIDRREGRHTSLHLLPNSPLAVWYFREAQAPSMATRCSFENSNDVGVFAKLTNAYCLVAQGGSENFYRCARMSARHSRCSSIQYSATAGPC